MSGKEPGEIEKQVLSVMLKERGGKIEILMADIKKWLESPKTEKKGRHGKHEA